MPHNFPKAPKPGRGRHEGGNGWLGGNHQGGNRGSHAKGCCSYQEAGRALVRGRGRLAVRYVRMDVKARLGLIQGRTA